MNLVLLIFAGLLVAALATGLVYQSLSAAQDAVRFPPPGRLIPIAGPQSPRLHLHAMGDSGPTIILDAGIGASSLSWSLVQPLAARFARVYAYDRAGYGWSDAPRRSESPRVASRLAAELRALLHAA